MNPASSLLPYSLGFLTDYGTADGYAGLLHAVALSRLNPEALRRTHRFDLSHGVPAHDVEAGRWILQQSLPYLPPQCAMVCVVDPYVGQVEQSVAIVARPGYQQLFIAPDNGLLEALLAYIPDAIAYSIPLTDAMAYGWPYPNAAAEASAGQTFHGRDVYTPLACHFLNAWAMGDSFLQALDAFLAFKVSSLMPSPNSVPSFKEVTAGVFECHIQYCDAFGNLITTLPHFKLPPAPEVSLMLREGATVNTDSVSIHLYPNYAIGKGQALFAVRGSHGFVELASFALPCASSLQVGDAIQLSVTGSRF
jgi:S-adenosyl-L-methionine hydrolase (adenosine-forming)